MKIDAAFSADLALCHGSLMRMERLKPAVDLKVCMPNADETAFQEDTFAVLSLR
jgi:hypothetical protein